MKAVAIFNNKGGVGKTTFLCNLAAALVHYRQKRVLVVDADPQCNATQYMFDDSRRYCATPTDKDEASRCHCTVCVTLAWYARPP